MPVLLLRLCIRRLLVDRLRHRDARALLARRRGRRQVLVNLPPLVAQAALAHDVVPLENRARLVPGDLHRRVLVDARADQLGRVTDRQCFSFLILAHSLSMPPL